MLKWKIYYGDGSTYEGKPENAPTKDVQVIIAQENGEWYLAHKKDYYWWENDTWYEGDIFGLWDYMTRPGWKKVLFGRTLKTDRYDQILKRAIKEKGEL